MMLWDSIIIISEHVRHVFVFLVEFILFALSSLQPLADMEIFLDFLIIKGVDLREAESYSS